MKPMSLYMYKTGDTLKWMPHQKTMYEVFVTTVKDDQTVNVQFQINRPRKTNPQLGYWYGALIPFARDELIRIGYDTLELSMGKFSTPVETNVDSVDNLFKSFFQVHKCSKIKPAKRNMSTVEMSELIDFALKWLAENLGVFCPTPKEM